MGQVPCSVVWLRRLSENDAIARQNLPCQRIRLLMLPGLGGSGPRHWQTLWASRQIGCRRFQPADWDRPDLADWLQALDEAIGECAAPVVLVAHSLSCLLVAHWALRPGIGEDLPHRIAQVRGAFLVAVPDPGAPVFPVEARAFGTVICGQAIVRTIESTMYNKTLDLSVL
ncbi:alpha/beta fold hydrolase [Marinobacter lutaoensis]|nr:alpha/beta fold hydrolase [Marinobacter lutaoensis]